VAHERLGPKRAKALRQALAWIVPEWQVFIRRPDGASVHFTFTRKRQLALVAGAALVTVWAGVVSMLLAHQPDRLAAKESQLEEMMAATRAAQHRLASSQKMVSEIAREVDGVHANLLVLAESNATLAKERTAKGASAARVRVGGEPSWNDDDQPGSDEARKMREQVRRLEVSLDRLKVAYSQVVQNTADAAGTRISDAERSLSRLGLDGGKMIDRQQRDSGLGGPFIPVASSFADDGLHDLLSRLDRWSGAKAVMQKMPLAEPLHQAYDINSGFGTRNDPLNNRTGVHEGVDFGAPFGTPVYATGEGVVESAGPWDRYGLTIDIDHGNGVTTRYAHLSRIKVKEGQKVTRNTVIGLLGNSGRSTGAHLHYEVRLSDTPQNPLKFITAGYNVPQAR
jgi:murein DD-endopeptidase MepM/ murein hydrolase activator NlpD